MTAKVRKKSRKHKDFQLFFYCHSTPVVPVAPEKTQTSKDYSVTGPYPMHDVVVMAVRAAVRAAIRMRSETSQNLDFRFIVFLI